MHTPQDIERLLNQGESPSVEFRVSTPFPESLSRLISGFANTIGGTLIVGIREPNTIIGTDIARFEKFVQKTKERLNGKVELSYYSIELGGKLLGVLEVKKSKIPIASPEGYFRRVGDKEVPLDANQIVELMSSVPDHADAIASLSKTIAEQSAEFGKLRESFEKANSWKRKALYAVLGAAATAVVKLVLAAFGLAGG
ncbi:AlbA family DNA-binding domain-containing protein [Rhodoferax aquaticus]|uniref:ATP-binding protein n=1 Tax=Rhodoferax aquaticus TaxID=2527691 RepID=A0A515EME3_9BURK|nr:RNA-binding domain-containing protein [Rhodoferax aquaticus]QDL53833.1 ATP-binding protein [Rhodoferax aquaticus]